MGTLRRASPVVLLLVGVSIAIACGPGRKEPRPRPEGWSTVGIASWYGEPFHGRRTANGEVFDMHLLTAAHKTLPFGTLLRVENLDNGKEVVVRVNDRGPFVKGRILDLSYEAGRRLGMDLTGLARVRITVLENEPAETVREARRGDERYTVQLGAFQTPSHAEALADDARRRGFEARVERSGPWYRVRVGAYPSQREAEEARRRIAKRLGVSGAVVAIGS